MRILVDQSGYELLNLGDAAMLQSCVRRLSREWPDAEIMVLCRPSANLTSYCPETIAVHRSIWQNATPYLPSGLGRGRVQRGRQLTVPQAVHAADIVVAAGGGYVTDTWAWHATGVFSTLSLAQRLRKPTAMFGQGIGPLKQRILRLQASVIFPKLEVLSLREGRVSKELALSLGVRPNTLAITGDDALELIEGGEAVSGDALGVNMRVTSYADVGPTAAAVVGDVVCRSAESLGVPIMALPVSRTRGNGDCESIRSMLKSGNPRSDVIIKDLTTPSELARATANCGAVVTGSYHAAVFALGQGVPTVCITSSAYYDGKFEGLQEFFPETCCVLSLLDRDFADRLRAAIDKAWHTPAEHRAAGRESASTQRAAGRAAYSQFRIAFDQSTTISDSIRSTVS